MFLANIAMVCEIAMCSYLCLCVILSACLDLCIYPHLCIRFGYTCLFLVQRNKVICSHARGYGHSILARV
jgi:hypothetical protein